MPRPRKTPAEVSAARSAVAKLGWSHLTPEQRTERAKAAAAARKEKRTVAEEEPDDETISPPIDWSKVFPPKS